MKCTFIKENNEQCQAASMKDSQYCFLHNPEIPEEKKKLVQAKGGKGNITRIQNPLPPITVNTPDDVVSLLTDTINRVRSGELDVRIANVLGYLSGHLIKALEVSEVDKRVSTIERIILERSTK